MSQTRRRIIMPSDVFPPKCGGAGWSAHALALALQERGEQVTAVVPRIGQSALVHRYDVLDVATINVAQPDVAMPVLRNLVREYLMIPRLQHAIRQAMVDPAHTIIHAQHILAAQAAMPFRQLGAKVIVTVRDHWPWDYQATGMQMAGDQRRWRDMWQTMTARHAPLQQRLLWGAYVRQMRQRAQLLQQADMVIGVSMYMRDRIAKYLPRSRVVAVPNMVDCAAIAQITAHAPTIANLPERFSLFVGKLERNKGAEMLPELILRIRPPAIVIAGKGPLDDAIAAAAQAAKVPCMQLDWVEHDDVLRLMARCESLWFPSSWDEPLSRVLLEGLACGAPIVAMPTGGTNEIFVHERSGIFAPDIASFVDAVQRLHLESTWRHQLQTGAKLRAQQLFDKHVVIKHVLDVYNAVRGNA